MAHHSLRRQTLLPFGMPSLKAPNGKSSLLSVSLNSGPSFPHQTTNITWREENLVTFQTLYREKTEFHIQFLSTYSIPSSSPRTSPPRQRSAVSSPSLTTAVLRKSESLDSSANRNCRVPSHSSRVLSKVTTASQWPRSLKISSACLSACNHPLHNVFRFSQHYSWCGPWASASKLAPASSL